MPKVERMAPSPSELEEKERPMETPTVQNPAPRQAPEERSGNGFRGDPLPRPGEDRRHVKEDVWSRALRYLAMATYPLLILNLLGFLSVASQDRNLHVAAAFPGQPPPQLTSSEVYLQAYLPLMAAGMLVGIVGILLNRIRTRRRRDRKYASQLLCILMSAIGVALFFWLR
jgi:hypothetical protein